MQWHRTSDPVVIVGLKDCVIRAVNCEASKLDCFSDRGYSYEFRTVAHPCHMLCIRAAEKNTPAAWSEALDELRAYLTWFTVGVNGGQGHLKTTTAEGYSAHSHFAEWQRALARHVYGSEPRPARQLRSSLAVPATERNYV